MLEMLYSNIMFHLRRNHEQEYSKGLLETMSNPAMLVAHLEVLYEPDKDAA